MSIFLDLFTYERVTQEEQNKVFHDCRFLKQVGKYRPGDRADAISIYLDLYIWSADDSFDEEIVLF